MRGARIVVAGPSHPLRIIPADAGSTGKVWRRRTEKEDHPRGCGEHNARQSISRPLSGSSPRMRGAHILARAQGCELRIIPADAGSTACRSGSRFFRGDHPRGCGEHAMSRGTLHTGIGSSPRMRGARLTRPIAAAQVRIIPADAGSTRFPRTGTSRWQDHPRGCGEHEAFFAGEESWSGSSPRMRGAPGLLLRLFEPQGIIPADAGSTYMPVSALDLPEDHPRGCGEHFTVRWSDSRVLGSSPRMRGAQYIILLGRCVAGIIPADAGSTITKIDWREHDEDHPRGCGEHAASTRPFRASLGSSPRMRGARDTMLETPRHHRIIPADAGSTLERRRYIIQAQDHPRGCGEHYINTRAILTSHGSSPRMRGAQYTKFPIRGVAGIIPADAGSTFVDWLKWSFREDHPRGCGEHSRLRVPVRR